MEVNFIACCSVSRVLCLWTGEKGVGGNRRREVRKGERNTGTGKGGEEERKGEMR